ncbi:MAG: hypothetical protein C0514_01270 [Candidatus Puniceispirillum sp.]|nr:hypothetical protein [Candidatus Puniceispirillum sp.]
MAVLGLSVSQKQIVMRTTHSLFQEVTLELPYTPPFDWEGILRVLRLHQMDGVELVTDLAYERVFHLEGKRGFVRVTHHAHARSLRAQIFFEDENAIEIVRKKIQRMFDLKTDMSKLDAFFMQFPAANLLWRARPGVRLASGWDAFEVAINTVLGQLVSVKRANALVKQLIHMSGEQMDHPLTGAQIALFPSAKKLAQADLSALGTTAMRKKAIKHVATLVEGHQMVLSDTNIAALKKQLLGIPGIGPWSVEYIALRALGDPDSFPGSDLGLKKELAKHPEIHVAHFTPYRSYLAVCLWNHYIAGY